MEHACAYITSIPAPSGDLESESQDRLRAVAVVTSAVLLLLLLPALGGRYYVVDDIGARELAFRLYYVNHLLQGESVTWSPHIFTGYYLLGDAHIGSQHPAIPMLYRSTPLHWAFTIETLALSARDCRGFPAAEALGATGRRGPVRRRHPVVRRVLFHAFLSYPYG